MLTADVYIYNKNTLNVEKRSFNEIIGGFDSASQTSLWKRDYSWMTSSVILSVLVVGNIIDSYSEHLLPGFSLAFHIFSLDNLKIVISLAMTCIWSIFWLAFIQYTCVVSYKGACLRKKWRSNDFNDKIIVPKMTSVLTSTDHCMTIKPSGTDF